MDHPPLSRLHRFQWNGFAGCRNPVSHPERQFLEGIVPAFPVPFDIQHHPDRVLLHLLSHQNVDQELHCPQGFSLASDEKARIIAGDIDHRPVGVGVPCYSEGRQGTDSGIGQQLVHHIHGDGGCMFRWWEFLDSNPGRFGADAKEAGLTLA